MYKRLIIAIIINMLSPSLHAGATWDRLIKSANLNPAHHNFCFFDSAGNIAGSNAHKKAYLASISKLVTTLMVAEKMGINYKHKTKFHYHPSSKSLHIEGGQDPLFNFEKLFFIVNQLNAHGITEVSNLTFNDQALVWPTSHWDRENSPNISNGLKRKYFHKYLQPKNWTKFAKTYKGFVERYNQEKLDFFSIKKNYKDLTLNITKAELNNKPSFDVKGADVKTLVHVSPKIQNFIKHMNVVSHNYYADEYFRILGGKKQQDQYLKNFMDKHFPNYNKTRVGFSASEPSIGFYNGSGLPYFGAGGRKDNYATCAIIITMIRELDQKLTGINHLIQNSVAVTGVDTGTIRSRLRGSTMAKKAVVKTGTTYPVSALAGMLNTNRGKRYFGVFNHRTMGKKAISAAPLRSIQNELVLKLISDLGGGKEFPYSRQYLNVIDQNLIVK